MEKLNFDINIDAPAQKVWNILWADDTYRKWTAAFHEGSYAESDWKEGSKILFLSPEGSGMVSRIAKKREPEFMSFEHLGEVIKGVEDTTSERVKAWAGSTENYILEEAGGKTQLSVEMDITDEFKEMFSNIWPKALQNVKQLAEQ
jgi:uncharacterized protein YndB with AHSA1/START domain